MKEKSLPEEQRVEPSERYDKSINLRLACMEKTVSFVTVFCLHVSLETQ